MLALIKYELKKILGNRAGMVACTVALLFLTGLPLAQYLTMDSYEGTRRVYSGLDAIEFEKEQMNSHAGPVTGERAMEAHEALEQVQETLNAEMDDDPENPEPHDEKAAQEAWVIFGDNYYSWADSLLYGPEDISTDLEANAKATLKESLDVQYFGNHAIEYTQAERDFWMGMADQVSWPLTYGYTGPWKYANMNSLLLGIGVLVVCIALSGVFAGEYQARTAAIVIPTKRGKSMLPWAKICASFIFVTVYWLLLTVATLGVYVAFCGVDGWDLPHQLLTTFTTNPYALTLSQAVLLKYLLAYVMSLGAGGLTLLLSSKLRSVLPVALIPIALIFLGVLAEVMNANPKIYGLAPFAALVHAYETWLLSYDLGGFVIDLPCAVTVLYLVLFVVCMPLAMRFFRRHQVA